MLVTLMRLTNASKPRELTRERMQRRQAQAIRLARDVVRDQDLASELEGLTVEEYAKRRGISLSNPVTVEVKAMARESRQDLEDDRNRLLEVLEDVQDTIDDVLAEYQEEEDEQGE
jgi:hypothetical protein